MTHLNRKRLIHALLACIMAVLCAVPQSVMAQAAERQSAEHVVSSSELQKATVDASQARQKNLDTVDKFFSSAKAQRALKSAQMNPEQVKSAVAGLSSQELAQLASRANSTQNNFAAGNINNRDLLIILVGIAALILIIVAVH